MKILRFNEVEIGGGFFFYGQAFHKIALETAEDAEGICHLFLAETEVEVWEREIEREVMERHELHELARICD